MKRTAFIVTTLIFTAPLLALAGPSVVDVPDTGVPTTINNVYDNVLCPASNWLFAFVLVIAVIVLLMGAIMFFTAGGNEDQMATARRFLTYALVGVAVAVLAKSLIFVVGNFLGATSAGFFQC
ncbi:MAG: hypothetical protein A2991_01670 [Candidatus Terrybacteria bacterium RIFCSPLOWO2_01_FULL_58_14]|uniref:TrbC/VirB2 family protein n=2 Tax=Candidatus Terryibacteriota TaxID=1817920 RepID=A0A1G2PY75_9BACT|nr:MAG: hypothetical protein A2682_02210 [Candidatus Terrybacteria bacterium RIFCSPHIGHO2_01_FULL_58_15]OHA53266.1 MAG: hypothetical protein A2991_01670 [Candidatus Terrybacteria bacterium RIFCSPLOWO2_01_FULL_58_14]